ncbi:TPA: flagellar biosynthetic protein FliR [Enterobacter hormaechei]|uniref:flagellar biosynthetic protein FliR n=1 Tax=Enterobacter TaxID=547 RepID=UPI000795579B|nr:MULTISPECIES: flagellar biosynthetic protein FliR [Enterobacter]MBD8856438.1 flagellar biosynthetic protein FliR [Enterobacter hormaechei]MBF4181424.1 flagellar biosynthetic protein FliR [Enterobacter hormaechei]MCM7729520.1 flagellar biosynthetic protein FliR [Enterobacter hormaechei]MCU2325725.1 flagellar biosynthetic protein FliR [Enterobacter hormaechei subsp. steigerwaltii]QPX96085.1 flagellar biosynthetic protein FliR [Enterobacter sp. YSU]
MIFNLPLEQLYALISHYFLVMVRISALLHVAPVFSEKAISARLRAALALTLALLLGGLVSDADIGLYSWAGVWTMAKQVLIGAAMGLTMQLLFAAVRLAGEIIGMQMGLSFATFFDPGSGNSPVIARLLNMLAMLLFLVCNGHLWLLSLLAETFEALPINSEPLHAGGMFYLVNHAGLIFSQGLILGLPVIALLLSINMVLALLNRLTPQLSIFVVGFPLTLTFGMLALLLIDETLAPFFERLMSHGFEILSGLLQALV